MLAVLEKLSIRQTPSLEWLLVAAGQIHALREGTDKPSVSRSSLLYAAIRTEPLVQAVLETNGLRLATFEQQLGFTVPPSLEEQTEVRDFPVGDDSTVVALQNYRKRWPERPLDALGLAAAILSHNTWNVSEHLRVSGLNVEKARARFDVLVGATAFAYGGAVDPQRYGFTELVRQVLNRASENIVQRNIALEPFTASAVMIAMTDLPRATEVKAPGFLRSYLLAQCGQERLTQAIEAWFARYETGRKDSRIYGITQPLAAVFEYATAIAKAVSRVEVFSARHLLGAFLAVATRDLDIGSSEFLATLDIDLDALKRAFLAWVEQHAPPDNPDDLAEWRRRLGIRDETFLARYNAEESRGDDWLNIDDHVQAFATMIASESIKPPLAVGLFGDWGSGKSFFMAKLRDAVAARAGRALAQGKDKTPYHGKIVQIEFNAWHYVEANLWASLVENVFSNLKLTTGETKKTIAERRKEVAKRIDELVADRAAAEEKVQKAEVARERAANELEATKKHAETAAAGLQGLRGGDVWDLLEIDPEQRKQLQIQLDKLGLKTALKSNEDVRKTLDELRGAGKRGELIGTWLRRQPLTIIGLAVIILLTPVAVAQLNLPDINQQVAQILAPLGTALAWIAARLKQANGYLDKIDTARQQIDQKLQERETARQKEIQDADTKLKDAVTAVTNAKGDLATKEQNVEDAKTELIELSSGRRLARFIDERASSDDYRKLLGVLATVRHDFSTLSLLMHPEEAEEPMKEEYRIDRIVLYIDDLDRCHPDRVVEVLQAVHLLLAFKLFVVVVGVDARWVSESLAQKHRALRDKDRSALQQEDDDYVIGYEAKPHDYLEKIFQVPFWLEPLDQKTVASYIEHLLEKDVPGQIVEPNPSGASGQQQPGSVQGQQTGGAKQQHQQQQQTTRKRKREEIDPKTLEIARIELEFMKETWISGLVKRSPRTAKRFVNTYRFIRAGMTADALDQYLADAPVPQFKVILTLLAIVVGAPDVSLEVFAEMKREESEKLTLEGFVGNVEALFPLDHPDRDEWVLVSGALLELSDGKELVGKIAEHVDDIARYSFRPPYSQLALRKRKREPIAIRIVEEGEGGPKAAF